jgi:hypothetical protein
VRRRLGRASSGTRVATTPDALATSTAATRWYTRPPRPGAPAVPPQPGHLPPARLASSGGCPLGSRSEKRKADRRARSDNARPVKVKTPAPGFTADSDAREQAGFRNGQPAPSLPRTWQQRHPPAAPPGGSDPNPAPWRAIPDFRARATPPPGTYGFSGVADAQLRLDVLVVRGCLRLRQGAGGCRRCRHGCRQR